MIYASVCSGIEAASVAWEPLGWRPAWFSEIEPFPCAVLAHRFPSVPNLGDMTKIKGDEYGAIDLLVGGTPCQDLSIAGKRMGFGGKRSVLALDFVRLAYESGAKFFAWENVPGVFSSNGGEDFAQFLSLLAGWEVDVPEEGWGKFGVVEQSPGCFGLAWRVLDVQYARVDGFPNAIPQRRNRVFVVGYLGDWRRAAQVLFEPEGLLGHTPPRREARKGVAEGAKGGVTTAGGSDVTSTLFAAYGTKWNGNSGALTGDHFVLDVARCLRAQSQCSFREDTETIVFDMKQPHNPQETETVNLTTGNCSKIRGDSPLVFDARGNGDGVTCPTVKGEDAGRPTDYTPVVCRMTAFGEYETDGTASTIKQRDYKDATDLVISVADVIHGDKTCNGKGWSDEGTAYTLDTMATQGVVYPINTLTLGGRPNPVNDARMTMGVGKDGDPQFTISAAHCHAVATASSVRRLTPIECERLMGFPDSWTRIPWRGKPAEDCPDGPRYKACGNSMGVNVMRWIGIRIQEVVDSMKIPLDTKAHGQGPQENNHSQRISGAAVSAKLKRG